MDIQLSSIRVIFCIYIDCNNNYSETFDLKFQEL